MAAVKQQDHVFLAAKLRQGNFSTVAGFEGEIRRRRADLDPFKIRWGQMAAVFGAELSQRGMGT